MPIKRCTSAFSVWVDGTPRVYTAGQLIEDSEPVYKTHRAYFEDVETAARPRTVEAATAAPGEQRTLGQPPAAASFDPGEHSVKEVRAYLEGADEEETARVLAAERNGKSRAGILALHDE